jgi:hypothetical protein
MFVFSDPTQHLAILIKLNEYLLEMVVNCI